MMARPNLSLSPRWVFILLAFVSLFYLSRGLGNIPYLYWDELLYVNAARAYLTSSKPYPIPDHPPLGKEILAVGISLFGDNPWGWRLLSASFGAVSLTLIAFLIFRLTRRLGVALFVWALMLLDPIFFLHLRMGLLDPPLTAFLLLAVTATYLFFVSEKVRMLWVWLSAAFLGLAVSTKMLGIVFFPILGGMTVFRLWGEDKRWNKILQASLIFALLPPGIFILSYLALHYTLRETWDLTLYIFAWHRVAGAETFLTSRWYEWLFIKNPVFYFYKRLGPDRWQTAIATGNFVLWIGAQLGALYALIRNYRRPEIWMFVLPIILQFALYAQKPSTFIHYMTEILPFFYILLGVAIGDLFDRYGEKYRRILQIDLGLFAAVALVVFINYFPFIYGKPITAEQMSKIGGGDDRPAPSELLVPSPPTLP